jgi:hypothetical protein
MERGATDRGSASQHYQGDMDLLIQRVEAERLHLLTELLPVYDHWQGLRVRPPLPFP